MSDRLREALEAAAHAMDSAEMHQDSFVHVDYLGGLYNAVREALATTPTGEVVLAEFNADGGPFAFEVQGDIQAGRYEVVLRPVRTPD